LSGERERKRERVGWEIESEDGDSWNETRIAQRRRRRRVVKKESHQTGPDQEQGKPKTKIPKTQLRPSEQ